MESTLKFGPFRLLHPIGSGGMGVVYKAVHDQQNHPVAIKVMIADKAREERFVSAFKKEVRAVAGLSHRRIIRIYDSGTVPDYAEALTEGRLLAGSPYLVMELANATMANLDHSFLSWPRVQTILLAILDGLAHSHARNLVHRDLKPDNVLLFTRQQSWQLKLSDFGLSHAMNTADAQPNPGKTVSGTPPYMAPEQISGLVRDQGPWTDLYALGCLTHWLVSGTPPFSEPDTREILRRHLSAPRPTIEPKIDVPDGFQNWTNRLLARDETKRFRRAADAAQKLIELDDCAPSYGITLRAETEVGESIELSVLDDPMATQTFRDMPASPTDTEPSSEGEMTVNTPALPAHWKRSTYRSPSLELVGVGLGLYGLRHIPLVGRLSQRDLLWNTLADTRHTGRPHGVLLTGTAGIGKTRLAQWLCERAHEVGVAEVLHASHSPLSGAADGLGPMVAEFLNCTGLSRPAILERVRACYRRTGPLDKETYYQCFALTELLAQSVDPDFDRKDQRLRFEGPDERFRIWYRFIRFATSDRPMILFFDDVHWGPRSLQFVAYLFDHAVANQLPVTIIMTARDEALNDDTLSGARLKALTDRPLIHHVNLLPLDDDNHRELIESLLGLERTVAEDVAARTAGNPLFAIQLVGDWVERGLLEMGDDGFRIPDGANPALPATIHHLLRSRLQKLVGHPISDRASDALLALEIAAVLGRKVNRDEWQKVRQMCGLTMSPALLDEMASRSLATVDRDRLTFIHGALRETLERIAREQQRLTEHHRHCATMLQQRYGNQRDDMAARLGHHHEGAGQYHEALAAYRRAMHHAWTNSEIDSGLNLYRRFDAVRKELAIDRMDRRSIEGELERVFLLHRSYRFDEATDLLDEFEPVCRAQQWRELLARILYLRTRVAGTLGAIAEGLEYGYESLQLYRAIDDPYGIALASYKVGWLERWRGNFDTAYELVEDAERRFADLDDDYHHNLSRSTLGIICLGRQEYERAADYFHTARRGFEALADTAHIANCHNDLGEVYRYQNKLDRAEEQYRKALNLIGDQSPRAQMFFNLNLACILLEKRDFTRAIPHLERSLKRAVAEEKMQFAGCAHAGMLAARAGTGDWEQFDHHLAQIAKHLGDTDLVDRDLARSYHWAGEQARAAGQTHRATAALELALEQWQQLEADERIETVQRWLRTT